MAYGQGNFQGQNNNSIPANFQYDWNANKEFLEHLVFLITKVDDSAAMGDVLGWFNNLKTLYRNVAGLLIKNKQGDLVCLNNAQIKAQFEVIRKLFPNFDSSTASDMQIKVAFSRQRIIQQKLDDLNIEIITAMHINKLIMPRTQSNPEFAALEI